MICTVGCHCPGMGGDSPSTRLRDWLDPSNLFITAGSAKPLLTGPATLTGASTYQINVNHINSVSWAVTAPAGVVASQMIFPTSGTGPTASLSALSSATNLTITFSVSAGQSYPIRFARQFETATRKVSGPLETATPGYNCTTRQLTLQALGGSSNPVEFMVVGVRRWETNPVVILPDGLVGDPEISAVTIFTRQLNGKNPPTLSSRIFDFRAACQNPVSTAP